MKSYSAIFIKAASIEDADVRSGGNILNYFRPIQVRDSDWVIARFSKDDGPPDDEVLLGEYSLIETRSERFGEMIFLYADSGTESFVYEHARDGKLLRKLVWFPLLDMDQTDTDDDSAPGWICIEGEPEAWEEAIFFRPEALERRIQFEKECYADGYRQGDFNEREATLRRIFADRILPLQGTYPSCDHTVASVVESTFGLRHPD